MMGILDSILPKPKVNEKLDAQVEKLDAVQEALKKGCEEVENLTKVLVKKANGALYPKVKI